MPADRGRERPADTRTRFAGLSGSATATATRLRALGEEAAARVYRAQHRRLRAPRRSRLTGRAALLALVICSLVVALAYPMREWVSQRAEINDQRRQANEARERVRELRDEKARWRDPAYVEQQARRHLHYLRPGETAYIMEGGDTDAPRDRDRGASNRAWYENLWDGLDAADKRQP
ncbi:septum formation initiator family protein [Streptomyces sp. OF3]|uniref:Septum formation initiator family protein n=1 Tax=Streptomyces alkaliterrae TaxID=2213162 RepID=A0A5P0YW99_9ACTN|nr:septum formation initiator family protein [Streptomyces alkaliterrae]MBB1262007.1 septum formation initiator family protein [Streptomyces alkaliterrae]MQS04558.1 septum formation initiator family protein [Streptomyces alkaliterrae]